jgi:hypothetical protein
VDLVLALAAVASTGQNGLYRARLGRGSRAVNVPAAPVAMFGRIYDPTSLGHRDGEDDGVRRSRVARRRRITVRLAAPKEEAGRLG